MSSEIKAGDRVMLVFACCADGRRHIGWVGEVEAVANVPDKASRCVCDYSTGGPHAAVTIVGRGWIPFAWLRKLPPDAELIDEDEDQTLPEVFEEISAVFRR